MALNFPGPLEARLFYTSATRRHEQRLNFNSPTVTLPGVDLTTVDVFIRGGIGPKFDVAIGDWIDLIKTQYPSVGGSFDYVEVWEYDSVSHLGTYLNTLQLGVAGTSGSTAVNAHQDIYTFRTQEGNGMRVELMESHTASFPKSTYAGLTANQQAIVDYLIGANGWIIARDTSYPVAFNWFYPGQNEALFKAIYRQ